MEVLDQTSIRANLSSEPAICSTPFSPNVAVEMLGTSVLELLVEELEERRKKKSKRVPTEVLDVNDTDTDNVELPSGLSLSHSFMSFGIFGILDLVDEWLRDNILMELRRDFAEEQAPA